MNFGKAFRKIREEQNLSRVEVARLINCTPSALSRIENSRTLPKWKTIEIFCAMTRTPIARFYLLSLDARDFAPIPSVADVFSALKSSTLFSKDDVERMTEELKKFKI